MTLLMTITLAWLITPFVSGALLLRSALARAVIARHLAACLAVGWLGVALLVWGATALEQSAGLLAFAVGGPMAGLSFWGRGGDGPPDDAAPPPVAPDWDWERFERDLRDYDAARSDRVPAR